MGATKTVGAYEAKTTLSSLLGLVEEGHEVVITRHDRPVAKLVPFARTASKPDLLQRLRTLHGRLRLRAGETPKSFIDAGRRI